MGFIRPLYPSWDDAYAEHRLRRFDLIPEHEIKQLSHGQPVEAGLLLVLARRPTPFLLEREAA